MTSLNIHGVTKVTVSHSAYDANDRRPVYGVTTLEITDENGNQTEIKLFHDGTLNLGGLTQ